MSTSNTTGSPSQASLIWLVAEREIGSKLRSKAFLISTGILLFLALAAIVIGGFATVSYTHLTLPTTPYV